MPLGVIYLRLIANEFEMNQRNGKQVAKTRTRYKMKQFYETMDTKIDEIAFSGHAYI